MITNIFSIFDPCTSISLSINWTILIFSIFLFNWSYWLIPSRFNLIWNILINLILNEFNLLTKKKNKSNLIIFLSLFYLILILNFLRLIPYTFTLTRHINFNLSLSLTLWFSFILYGWIENTKHIFAHIVPLNTPILLIRFIVLIETIRNLIRPWTLAIRLSANILAGHLLLSLLRSSIENISYILPIIIIIQNLLLILEISVAFIQSYVFSILTLLYFNETN